MRGQHTERYRSFRVTIDCVVTDTRAAIKAARDSLQAGPRRDQIPDTRAAVHHLLDPGSKFEAGIEIELSTCEEIDEGGDTL